MLNRLAYPAAYVAAIVATNIGFNLWGPSLPVFTLVAVTMVLRDFVQGRHGWKVSAALVVVGAVLSAVFSSPAIAVASLLGFLVSELADLAVFTAVERRLGVVTAVALSGIVGSVIDSFVFLEVAFGSLAFFGFQVSGKVGATLVAAALIAAARIAVRRRSVQGARMIEIQPDA